MKDVLIIKTEMLLTKEAQERLREQFKQQVKEGVVIIPAYLDAELLSVPDDVEIVIEAANEPVTFLNNGTMNFNF